MIDLLEAQKTLRLLKADKVNDKHKLKTQISSFLKSSGSTRAYGAVLARECLKDWSAVSSHGHSWAVIMLHALDLPDQVCWKPITTTLTFLFEQVHGKPDLMRQIAGSKVSDFIKRIVNTIQVTECFDELCKMLTLYPTQCRPFLNKLEPLLTSNMAKACLCISEKSTDVFTKRFLSTNDLDLLLCYLKIAPIIKVKVPINTVFTLLNDNLKSMKNVLETLDFISKSFDMLSTAYLLKFDLIYAVGEVIDMGSLEAISGFEVFTKFILSAGSIPPRYGKLMQRVALNAISLYNLRFNNQNVDGLADFVNKEPVSTLNIGQIKTIVSFLVAVGLNVDGLQQSVRMKIDKIVLAEGTYDQISLVALYPGKYSVLPLAIQRVPTLCGMQCLVHPRLPPMVQYIQRDVYDEEKEIIENEKEEDKNDEIIDENTGDTGNTGNTENTENAPAPDAPTPSLDAPAPDAPDAPAPAPILPPIPDARVPSDNLETIERSKPELSTPPEKRQKIDSDEEFEMPSLVMDSD